MEIKIKTLKFIKKEPVLTIASLLAVVSSMFSMPKLEYIDFKVLVLLFNLMIIVAACKKLKLFDAAAIKLLGKCKNVRAITITLVLITFFSSMLLTNDVSLITFVPLTLIIAKKADIDCIKIIVLETIAANLGSALTPMGNPQNLFLYSYFNMTAGDFFMITMPLTIVSFIILILLMIKSSKKALNINLETTVIENKKQVWIYGFVFLLILLSVFHVLDYRIAFAVTIITVLLLDKSLFKNVDYSLLMTFIAFFIFIGNISSMESVKSLMSNLLATGKSTYFASIITSQFISNVPATMLISPFTAYSRELILGVNIGGLGTLIASLASLISYKLFVSEHPDKQKNYFLTFTLYNFILLIIITVFFAVM